MNCLMCGKLMEIYEIRTTYNKDRKEFQRTGYRCRQDDVWAMTEIPKNLVPQEQQREAIAKENTKDESGSAHS